MNNKTFTYILAVFIFVLTSCQFGGVSVGDSDSTVKPGEATAVPQTATLPPIPTDTLVPTETPLPTEAPTITPTPGPMVIKDDFSSQSDIWGKCENCTWRDGMLVFGPFPPSGSGTDQIFYILCEACGLHTYYKVSADVTFKEGYGDRTFGILAGLTENEDFLGAGTVSTLKHALYETFDFNKMQWGGTSFKEFGAVKAARGTNRITVEIKPTSSAGRADIFVIINGTTVIRLYDQPVEPTKVGLYLGWHTVGAIFDNFEYEEILP